MNSTNNIPSHAYSVSHANDRFEVCAPSGRIVMVCMDSSSASHYASLLNEAFNTGYKKGYKEGRRV